MGGVGGRKGDAGSGKEKEEVQRGVRRGIPGSPTSCSEDTRARRQDGGGRTSAKERGGMLFHSGRNFASGQEPPGIQVFTLAAQTVFPLKALLQGALEWNLIPGQFFLFSFLFPKPNSY